MRHLTTIGAFLVAVTTILTVGAGTRATTTGSPVASPAASVCPITEPNGNQPPPEANVFGRGNGDYGNDALWTSLWVWGEGAVQVPDDHVNADGSLGPMKWPWYRYLPGKLTIEGRRLDAPAPPLLGEVNDGYGDQGFTPSGLTFPTYGCWEVTGYVGGGSLTFVVLVVPLATGTPEAALSVS